MSSPARTQAAHHSTRRALAAAVAVAAVALAACSPAAVVTTSPSSSPAFSPIPPGDASGIPSIGPSIAPSIAPSASAAAAGPALLLEVTSEGGFINPAASIGALPTVVVDTDGRIYTPGTAADGSSPLIPVVEMRDTGPAGAAAILAAMKAAGLDTAGSAGGVAADTGTTVFTATIDGATVVNRVSAGGMGGGIGGPGVHPGASGQPGASAAPGAAALALLARVTDPAETWGAGTAPIASVFAPAGYRLWVAPAASGATGAATVAWPLAADPATFGSAVVASLGVTGLRSGILIGADAAALGSALAKAASGSTLTAGGKAWQVWVRPLFPDELAS